MHSLFLLIALLAVSDAFLHADAIYQGTPTSAQGVLAKRTACAPQSIKSNAYSINATTYDDFLRDPAISSVANAAPTPPGYQQTFKNAKGSSQVDNYLGYSAFTSYDVNSCADQCSAKQGCLAFNMYFERDPTVDPGTGCDDPPAYAQISCSWWGSPVNESSATNTGQMRASFTVAIAGSNGYTSAPSGSSSSTSGSAPTGSSTPGPSQRKSSGLSTGAAAGIGVGVGIVVLGLILVAGYLLYRRRSNRKHAATATSVDQNNQKPPRYEPEKPSSPSKQPILDSPKHELATIGSQLHEAPANAPVYELPVENKIHESPSTGHRYIDSISSR